MSSLKHPPEFNPEDGLAYEEWKNDVNIWRLYTKEEIKKQGPAIYLSLRGDAREAVRDIPLDDLSGDTGFEKVLEALDKVYLRDENTRAFCAVKSFVEFKRQSGVTFPKFIVDFEGLYREVKKFKLKFDDGILAYFLLSSANLSVDHERLVRTSATLTYDSMRETLQKVFGEVDSKVDSVQSSTLPVKEEVFLTGTDREHTQRYRGQGSQSNNWSKRSYRDYKGQSKRTDEYVKRNTNPVGQDGRILRCHECDSTKHFIDQCPHVSVEKAKLTTVHLTLVMSSTEEELVDNLGRGILDSACTKTVAGELWISEYLELLSPEQRNQVSQSAKVSYSIYRFGDGVETKSSKALVLPVTIFGKNMYITVDVVQNNIPLLISRPTMSNLGMVIDTVRHTVKVGRETFKLQFNVAGHYTIPITIWADECNIVLHFENLAGTTRQEKKKKAKKLHRQFAHASKERLTELLKLGGCDDQEFIQAVKECCEQCEFCMKYRKSKSKPFVALSEAEKFNEVMAMDLKEVQEQNLNPLHNAKLNFVGTKTSNRIPRTLRHNVCTYEEEEFFPGDRVYYQKRAYLRWEGPAKVIGKDRDFVILRHGANVYRCHPSRLMRIDTQEYSNKQKDVHKSSQRSVRQGSTHSKSTHSKSTFFTDDSWTDDSSTDTCDDYDLFDREDEHDDATNDTLENSDPSDKENNDGDPCKSAPHTAEESNDRQSCEYSTDSEKVQNDTIHSTDTSLQTESNDDTTESTVSSLEDGMNDKTFVLNEKHHNCHEQNSTTSSESETRRSEVPRALKMLQSHNNPGLKESFLTTQRMEYNDMLKNITKQKVHRHGNTIKIFLGNLSSETTSDIIQPLFEEYGKVTECDVLKNFGFVHMLNKNEASKAIAQLDGYSVNGNKIRVELSTGKKGGRHYRSPPSRGVPRFRKKFDRYEPHTPNSPMPYDGYNPYYRYYRQREVYWARTIGWSSARIQNGVRKGLLPPTHVNRQIWAD